MESIYSYFLNEQGVPKDSYMMLPELEGNESAANWIPGAYEGIMLRGNVDLRQPFYVNFFVSLNLKKAIYDPSKKNIGTFCNKFMKYSAITMVDSLISHLSGRVDKNKALSFARELAKNAERAELLKLAIALLGEYGDESDLPMLRLFSSHEEFTLYGAVAIKNILIRANLPYNGELIELCKILKGWGKIGAIVELDFSDEIARDYTVKYGCYNVIDLSYLSNICAIKGRLTAFLKACLEGTKIFDEDALNGVCDIWDGLTAKTVKTNDGLTDYPKYAEAYDLFKEAVARFGFETNPRAIKAIDEVRNY